MRVHTRTVCCQSASNGFTKCDLTYDSSRLVDVTLVMATWSVSDIVSLGSFIYINPLKVSQSNTSSRQMINNT